MDKKEHCFKIDSKGEGERLDAFLAKKIKNRSRSSWQDSIKRGEIRVNQKKVIKNYRLKKGQVVRVLLSSSSPRLLPEKGRFKILFENQDFLVIDKPAGIVVHPAPGHQTGTLLNFVLAYLGHRPYLVHRLDKYTSGLILVAKSEAARDYFARQFKERKIEKKYLALVEGKLEPRKGRIDLPLSRDMIKRTRRGISPGGRRAITEYQVRSFLGNGKVTLVEACPFTGRTHQIRVHFAAIKHPVIGDAVYGLKKTLSLARKLRLKRQFLHATSLKIRDRRGKWRVFSSSLSPELNRVLDKLKGDKIWAD